MPKFHPTPQVYLGREEYERLTTEAKSLAVNWSRDGGSVVYFLQRGGSRLIKIGRTVDPLRRFTAIRGPTGASLKLLRLVPGGLREEAWFHRRFAASRSEGEWFWFDPEMVTAMPPWEVTEAKASQADLFHG